MQCLRWMRSKNWHIIKRQFGKSNLAKAFSYSQMPMIDSFLCNSQYIGHTEFGLDKVKIHGAFVHGENDALEDVQDLVYAMGREGLHARFNVIRYNPPTVGPFSHYKETTDEQREIIVDWLRRNNPGGVKEIARVGVDVFASCGTFFH